LPCSGTAAAITALPQTQPAFDVYYFESSRQNLKDLSFFDTEIDREPMHLADRFIF